MKYDFETIMDRRGKDAIAVDIPNLPGFMKKPEIKEGYSMIPMWVADMNFPTAPSIVKAMMKRVEHPAYGYYMPSTDYYESIIKWHEKRHGVTGLTKSAIGYENGVLGGVISALQVLCSPGDKVLVHSPTYVGFTMSLTNNGFKIVHSDLIQDEHGVWRMNYEDMDKKIKANRIHTAIFCSPHNPCGRVWERWEIEKAMEVYQENQVYVVADEIWSDLILAGYKHTPTQMVSDYARSHTVAVYAPSKTYNLAGLIGAYHIIYDKWLRDRVNKQSSLCHYNAMNVLSMHALIGAYSNQGEQWLEELKIVLTDNINYACHYIEQHFEGVTVAKPEGTYMLFLDCEQWCTTHHKTLDELIQEAYRVGVIWQDGRQFNGKWSVRLNLALPLSLVKEAMNRLDQHVFNTDLN